MEQAAPIVSMDQATHNKIVSFIWGIADDVLRDLFKRGKYPDVILPMCVIRRMDAVLEPTKKAVLDTKKMLDEARITEQRAALCDAAGQAFYNTSKFTLRDLKSRGSQQQLLADFEDYLNGFSPNVQDILDNFKFRNQLPTLSKADALGTLINKFLDPDIDLSPAGIDNHSMGTVFEELVRKFNEENNEEAGEHWTPRDAVRLMANLIFLPDRRPRSSPAPTCSTTAPAARAACSPSARRRSRQIGAKRGQQVNSHLYGQEINPETYAICKADMLLKGEGESADHIVGGAEWSTLSHDAFPAQEFDFMLSNPPYGKSWKKDLEAMGGKDGMRDPRFKVMHKGEELSLVTRSSDGQMLFLANMASKMNAKSAARQPHRRGPQRLVALHRRRRPGREQHPPLAHRERLARSHRRPAAQPLLQHRHRHLHLGAVQQEARAPQGPGAAHRRHAMVQAAAQEPRQEELRTLARGHRAHLRHLPRLQGNARVEDLPQRRLRLLEGHGRAPAAPAQPAHAQGHRDAALRVRRRRPPRRALRGVRRRPLHQLRQGLRRAGEAPRRLGQRRGRRRRRRGRQHEEGSAREEEKEAARPQDLGARRPPGRSRHASCARSWATTLFEDHNVFRDRVDAALKKADIKLAAADLKQILKAVSWRVETAPPVIAKVHKPGKAKADPLRGLFEATVDGKPAIVEYEPDSDLRDTEQVPLLEDGGIEAFIRREVLPYTPDAWIKEDATKIGYEVSFTRHFYKPQPLRTLEEISADILAIEKEAEGLLDGLLKVGDGGQHDRRPQAVPGIQGVGAAVARAGAGALGSSPGTTYRAPSQGRRRNEGGCCT